MFIACKKTSEGEPLITRMTLKHGTSPLVRIEDMVHTLPTTTNALSKTAKTIPPPPILAARKAMTPAVVVEKNILFRGSEIEVSVPCSCQICIPPNKSMTRHVAENMDHDLSSSLSNLIVLVSEGWVCGRMFKDGGAVRGDTRLTGVEGFVDEVAVVTVVARFVLIVNRGGLLWNVVGLGAPVGVRGDGIVVAPPTAVGLLLLSKDRLGFLSK